MKSYLTQIIHRHRLAAPSGTAACSDQDAATAEPGGGLFRQILLRSLALVFTVCAFEAQATNFTVNNASDANTGSGTTGTLRWCIGQANASAGPHTITFSGVTSTTFASDYPTIVRQVTIDGGPSKVIIQCTAGDGGLRPFYFSTGASGSTLRNLDIRGGGYEPIRVDGNLSDMTFRNLVCSNSAGNYWNYGLFITGNATNYVIDNFVMKNLQYGSWEGIYFGGTTTNVSIDSVRIIQGLAHAGTGFRFLGVANTISITNCYIDMDDAFGDNNGDRGIWFNSSVTDLTMTNDTINRADVYGVEIAGVLTNANITNFRYITGSYGDARGFFAHNVVSGITMDNIYIDMDVYTTPIPTQDDGNYGIYFENNVSNMNINNVTMHAADIYGLFVAGTLTGTNTLTNSTFDNYYGEGGNQMIRFNSTVTGLTMSNVKVFSDVTGTTDDGNIGVAFIGAITNSSMTNVRVDDADSYGVFLSTSATNFTMTSCKLKRDDRGIYIQGGNYVNVDINNCRIDSSGVYGVEAVVSGGGSNGDVDFNADTIQYAGTDGILIRWPVLSNVSVTNCILAHNGRTSTAGDGIQVQNLDDVIIHNNSIFDNAGLGINLYGDGNCSLDGIRPVINSITPNGGGSYTVNFTIPAGATASGATFAVHFYTNTVFAGAEGEYFAHTASGYATGTFNITFTTTTGPAANPGMASLTMTFTRTGSSCTGTSEFSNSLGLDPQGPGCVDAGITGWYRVDRLTGYTNGQTITDLPDWSGNGNKFKQYVTGEMPTYFSGDATTNFNPSIVFDGANDNLEIANGVLPTGAGGTLMTAAYVNDQNGCYDDIYNQNIDDPSLARNCNTSGELLLWDNGNTATAMTAMKLYNTTSAIFGMDYGTTAATTNALYNGLVGANLGGTASIEAGIGYIGGENTAETWNGKIHEVMMYSRELNATERQKVNSYLSIKWGASLDTSILKVAGASNNLIAGDGTVIWTANTGYYHRVSGIGRDDCDSLYQKQSRNVNLLSPGYVTVGLGTIAANNQSNPNTIAADKNFMTWGDDNKSGSGTTTITGDGTITLMGGSCTQYARLAKTYRVEETGTIGAVKMEFNMTGVKLGKTVNDYYLAIHTSDVFTGTIEKLVAPSSYDNVTGILVFDNVNFASNAVRYFTVIGKRVYGPANITSNLKVWLKAEDGIANTTNGAAVDIWGDQGPGGNDVTQSTVANQPIYYSTTNLVNFNPVIKFDGANDDLEKATGVLGTGNVFTGATLFVLNNSDNPAAGQRVFRQENTSSRDINLYAPYGNTYYFDAPYPDRLSAATSAFAGGAFNISTGVKDNSGTNTPPGFKQVLYNNAKSIDTGTGTLTYTSNNSPLSIGSTQAGEFHNGKVGEVIYYSAALTATERQKINSYLSIKWGVSLDQTTALDYLSANGTTIWNGTTNATYKYRVTGIGRDDCSDLTQKQSRNQDTTSAYVTMGIGTIAATNQTNTGTFSADGSFLIWGDDNVAGASVSAVTGDGTITLNGNGCGVYRRLAKTFKVQKTGAGVGAVQVLVNLRGITLGKVAADHYLAIHSSATFSGVITKLVQASSYSNGVLTFNNVTLTDGQYFTVIGLKAQGPGNITSTLKLWVRADDGIELNGSTVSRWNDQGPAGKDAVQATVTNQPTYNSSTNLINFNPTVSFNGTDNWLRTGSNIFGTGNISYTTFGIAEHAATGNRYYLSDGAALINQAAWFGQQGATTQAQANWLNDLASGALTLNKPYLEGFIRDGSSNQKLNYQSALFMGSNTGAAINKSNNGWAEIGANTVNTELFSGKIGEMVAYESVLSATDQQKVYSYLAVKWGFTLDQSSPYDYLSAAGTVIWNGTTYATYKNRITGIGRDDCSDLQQKQSKSVETGALVTISNGTSLATTNDNNTSTFGADNSWLLFGDNNKGITWTGSGVPINGGNVRLNRVWRVKETGTVGTVYVEVPDATSSQTYKLPTTTNNIYLLVANSGTNGKFSAMSGVTVQLMTFDATNKKWYTTYNFADGDYFTFGSEKVCIAPVGISEGLTSWYSATDMALGNIAPSLTNALLDLAFSVYPLNRNALGTATVLAGSATSFNYNRCIGLSGNASFIKASLNFTDLIESTAGSMYAVGTSNTNLFTISSLLGNGSGCGSTALFNGTGSSYGSGIAGKPNVFGMVGSTTNVTGFTNGTAAAPSGSIAARLAGLYTVGLGQNGINLNYNNGQFSEAFTYNRVLDPEERNILESYLAIKYGVTLSHDYYNADYDGSNAATTTLYEVSSYANRIFGVGTDTTGCFYQKQSTSVLAGAMLKLNIGSTFATENNGNTSVFLQDRAYVMAGDDNGAINAWVTGTTPYIYNTTCVLPTRILRQWKIKGTYQTPTCLFAIPDDISSELTKLPACPAGYSVWMVINGNPDFSINDGQQEIAMTLNNTTNHWECQYQVPAGATKYLCFVLKDDDIETGSTAPLISLAETDNSCTADDGKIISGASALLTPTVGASYSWNTGATTSTLTVMPTMTTSYTVTVTALNGCTSSSSFTVTVVVGPSASITETDNSCTSNDSQVLSGDMASLTASGGGTYSWDDASTNAARTVSPTMTTTYTVTVSNADGCTSTASHTITTVTAPTVSLVGSNSICIGDLSSVSPTSGGTWTSSNPSIATVTNAGVVTGVSAGSAAFTFTSSSTGCVSASTPAVTVNATPSVSITGSNNICVGATTTLSPSTGGTWASSNNAVATVTNAGVVTGVAAGTATFTFTNSTTGCVSAATAAVTINALPVVSITGATTICAGLTTTLSPTTGGTWSSSDITVATVTNAGVVTGVGAGTVYFTFTKTAAPNCSASTGTVTVNPSPIVSITGDNTICVGETTNLSPNGGGTWTSSNVAKATVTNAGIVTAVASGTVTFTYTSTATGCSATTPPVNIDPLPSVSITGAVSICVGLTTTLSPTSGGTWTCSNPSVASVTNAGVVTGIAAGSATFTFTSSTTGCVSLPTASVTVTALPSVSITGPTTICVGSTTTLSPTSGGTWTCSNPLLATVTNAGLVTGLALGTVSFTFTSSSSPNCSASIGTVTIQALPSISITGASTICVGATTTLTPNTGGTWTSSNPSVATVTNAGVVTGVSAGICTFTFTETGSGCASLPSGIVTVNALPSVSITGSASICVGFTTTLSPALGGTWTSSDPSIATVNNLGIVTGVAAGTVTFTFTSSVTGCTSVPTAPVTVNAIPTVSITGPTSICIGDVTGLSPTTGGTWISTNPLVASVTNAGVVTGLASGTTTFIFTQTGTGCISLATAVLTVNAIPNTFYTGPTSICVGATTTLSPTGGTWISTNPSIATITNAGVVTAVAPGSCTFIYTSLTTGCVSLPSAPLTVNALPLVGITGSNTICVGATTVLSPTSGGTWLSSDLSVATVTNAGVVTGVSGGLCTFIFTNTTTGCVSLPTAPVTVNPLPVATITGPTSICVGATTGLSPSTGGTWASTNAAVATVTNAGVVTGVSAGTCGFIFTNTATGCVSLQTGLITVNAIPTVSITGSTSICIGATTTLSPTSGGTWVSTNAGVATVSNAGVVTGVSAGTCGFIFTNTATGCVSLQTGLVTVNPTPIVSITGPTSICVGATTTLSPTSGGTWTCTNPLIASVTNAGVVTGLAAGTATFIFTDATSGCVSVATSTVTVNAIPLVSIVGASTICVGTTTTLSPSSGGTWVSSNASVASVTNAGVVTGVSAGTATFIFTNSTTGCVSLSTGTVTVNPLPIVSITGPTSICVGTTTNLSPTSGGVWTCSNNALATVTNAGVVTGVAAGNVNFTFTNSLTGCVSASTPTVTVNALPLVSITGVSSICVGSTTSLAPTTGGTWASSNNTVCSVTNGGVVTGVAAGLATFTFTNSTTGCVSLPTAAVTVNALPVVNITGSSSICIGSTTTLSPIVGGTWTCSNPAVASVTNAGVVTGIAPGTATFTFTNTATGCVSLPTATVTVNAGPSVSITGPTSICVGATTTLSPTSGGTWICTNPAVASVTNAGLVTGISAGAATFIFTSSITGCASVATGVITVNAVPIVSITGSNNICVGATTNLSPTTGGTWASSNNAIATVTNSGVVTGVGAGICTFIFTNSSTGCVSLATGIVTINALPTVSITGLTNICIGSTTTLSPSTGGTWTCTNPSVASVTNAGVVTGLAAGTATFIFTNSSTGCTSLATGVVTVTACNSIVDVKAILGGGYDAGTDLMVDELRLANLIPNTQPYGGPQYSDFGYTGSETIGAGVLSVSGDDAIVDWVLLELRSASNPATVISRKAALIQRDGDVVESSDGVSPVTFIGAPANNYYVVIRHRNHLGVMTANPIALSGSSAVVVNFSSNATANYQLPGATGTTYAQKTLDNGNRALWEGNMSNVSGSGHLVQYQGVDSDSDEPYYRVLTDPGNTMVLPNYIVIDYDRADGNLDGKIIFQGSGSDSDIPFFIVLPFPDNTLFLPNYVIYEQIP